MESGRIQTLMSDRTRRNLDRIRKNSHNQMVSINSGTKLAREFGTRMA